MEPVRLGAYRLTNQLPSDGLVEAWEATQEGIEGFSREVVLKRITPEYATEQHFVERFLAEARVAARLSHPNIVQILDFGERDGSHYVAMERIVGRSLEAMLERTRRVGKRVPRATAFRIVADAAAGLYYAHTGRLAAGRPAPVLHGDVSPHCILLTVDGLVKLVDFGLAAAAADLSPERTGALIRSALYLSPEQADGQPLTPKSDLFSLGLVLYTLLTGASPYARENVARAELLAARRAEIPAPSSILDIPRRVDAVVLRALARDPDARYADCRELQLALEEAIVAEGTLATSVQVAELLEEHFRASSGAAWPRLGDSAELTPRTPVSAVTAERRPPPAHLVRTVTDAPAPVPAAGRTSQPRLAPAVQDTLADHAMVDRKALAALRGSVSAPEPSPPPPSDRREQPSEAARAGSARDTSRSSDGARSSSSSYGRLPSARGASRSALAPVRTKPPDTDPDYVPPALNLGPGSTTSDGDRDRGEKLPVPRVEPPRDARLRLAVRALVALAVAVLAVAGWLYLTREPPQVVTPLRGE